MDGVVAVPPRIETTLLPIADFAYSPLFGWPFLQPEQRISFFLQLEEAILIKRQNLDQTSPLQLFVILKMATSRYFDFLTLIINNKMLLCNYSVLKKILHFFYSPCYLS